MSAKRTPYLRPYSPPPLHLIDVVLLCAHRTTIYFGIDRFAFKFAIEDVLADAYDYGIDFDIIGNIGERIRGVSANSLCCCRIGSSTAREGIRVGPSRANDYYLLVFPRLYRLADVGVGTGTLPRVRVVEPGAAIVRTALKGHPASLSNGLPVGLAGGNLLHNL